MSERPARMSAAPFVVEPEDEGERLDVVLGRRVPGLSRRVARQLGLEGKLRVEGQRAAPSQRVRPGQSITMELANSEASASDSAAHEHAEPTVLSERDDYIFVAKPAGMHTHALRPDDDATLADWVLARNPECRDASEDPREGGATHRLDRPTSGVVCFARTREAWTRARAAFTAGRVHKRYLAVAARIAWPPTPPADALAGWIMTAEDELGPLPGEGLGGHTPLTGALDPLPPPLRLRAPLGRGAQRGQVAVRLDGQRASTVARPIAAAADHLLVDLLLETGHRHQIRAHLAWIGAPLRGDARYGGTPAPRLGLHALALAFEDGPGATCPPPPDLWAPTSPT